MIEPGPRPVPADLLARVLEPYKPHCRYLDRAGVTVAGELGSVARIDGELAIGSSCYIDDTGHFNSVEFNLCYNQLVYVLIAELVRTGDLPALPGLSLEEYFERQLPDVLIHDFSSKFRRPMRTDAFRGTVELLDATRRSHFALLHTRVAFEDDGGGSSHGAVSLAIVDRRAAARPARRSTSGRRG